MSEFKVGDKVIVSRPNLQSTGWVGTVINCYLSSRGVVRVGFLHGKYYEYNPKSLKAVRVAQEEPSADFEEGDYVRLSVTEGLFILIEKVGQLFRVEPIKKGEPHLFVGRNSIFLESKRPTVKKRNIIKNKESGRLYIAECGPFSQEIGGAEKYVKATPIGGYGVIILALRYVEVVSKEETPFYKDSEEREKTYYLFNPESSSPPRVKYASLEEAREVQKTMCTRNPGQMFIILECVEGMRMTKRVETSWSKEKVSFKSCT